MCFCLPMKPSLCSLGRTWVASMLQSRTAQLGHDQQGSMDMSSNLISITAMANLD